MLSHHLTTFILIPTVYIKLTEETEKKVFSLKMCLSVAFELILTAINRIDETKSKINNSRFYNVYFLLCA